MSIPMVPVSVKFHPHEIPELKQLAESHGFDGHGEYIRHLVEADKELMRRKWAALNPIFSTTDAQSKTNGVVHGSTEI